MLHTIENLKKNGFYAYNYKGLNLLLDRNDPLLTPTGLIITAINENDIECLYFRKVGVEQKSIPFETIFNHLDAQMLEFSEIVPKSQVKEIRKVAVAKS